MSSDLRNELVEYFKPHNQRLYDFLGKSFDWDKQLINELYDNNEI